MKILIELPTWLGDAVMATPAIENLANFYNDVEITFIGSFVSIEALKNHPKVIKILVLDKIKASMQAHVNDPEVEALVFDFYHFYGNANSYLDSPGWYRSEARIIKNSVRSYAPDGLFWLVLDSNKNGRYPKAKHTGARCYHYGWVRSEEQMNLKSQKVQQYWGGEPAKIDYSQMDQSIIKEFSGSHPKIVQDWLPQDKGIYQADPNYESTKKQKKHRLMLKLEKLFGLELSKKHYKLIK